MIDGSSAKLACPILTTVGDFTGRELNEDFHSSLILLIVLLLSSSSILLHPLARSST
jgi:hypothetical protein